MDSFKPLELARMELGGNNAWKKFWESNTGQSWGEPGQGADGPAQRTLEERYGGDIGEEYKERLGCKVEGKEFTGVPIKERNKTEISGIDSATLRTASPLNASGGMGSKSQKEMNEEFFARKGNENKFRPEGVAPSQGGKYGGFGSEPAPSPGKAAGGGGGVLPSADEFQADPVAALTKGFGWFTSTVGKGAKTLNDGYIQPTAQKVHPSTSTPPFDLGSAC